MPDETLMVSFHQATGPFTGRPHARPDILHILSWPPGGNFGYDMTATTQQIIHLASTDRGQTWEQVSTEPWHSPMNGISCGPEIGLPDGTIIRGVWGQYLPFYDVPQTGYVQRSTDGGQTWGPPQVIMDPNRFITFPGRLRLLKNGRLALTGGFSLSGPEVKTRGDWSRNMKPAMWVSADKGNSWSEPIEVIRAPDSVRFSEECDFAQLSGGQLLFVIRADNPPSRWQSVLRSEEDTFKIMAEEMLADTEADSVRPDPDAFQVVSARPAPFPHSGYPEMLAAREGVALHLATSGIHWTADAGQTWNDLGIGGTGYYPRSVQLPDGTIFCVYHRGGDQPYDGSADQEIQAMTFRLEVEE